MSSNISDRTSDSASELCYELGGYPLDDIPKLLNSDRFEFSAGDVLRWVQTNLMDYNQYSYINRVFQHDQLTKKDIEKNGRHESDLIEIRSLREHTHRLKIRFKSKLKLPIRPENPLMDGVATAILERLETILCNLVSTDRHKRRNHEFYKLACSLRLYAENLETIHSFLANCTIDGYEVFKRRGLLECYQKGVVDNVAHMRPESIPSDLLATVRTIYTEAIKVIPLVTQTANGYRFERNAAQRVISLPRLPPCDHIERLIRQAIPKRDWSEAFILPRLPPDNHFVELIRAAIPQIRKWSEEFSIQADEPPGVASETPTAERDAPAVKSKGGRPGLVGSTKPEDIAKLKVYERIRTQLPANPTWKAAELSKHFKHDTDIKETAKKAGMKIDTLMYRAAIKWIGLNPIANT